MKYRVYVEPDENGVFVATCPALPGCVSQGRTRLEATANIREAIEGYLESLRKHADPVPPRIYREVIEVAGGRKLRGCAKRCSTSGWDALVRPRFTLNFIPIQSGLLGGSSCH
jgi:antitoxin HicB